METKIGPAFSNLGFVYRGEGHGSIQDANMVIDGQRSPDVVISVGTEPITKLIDNNPSLAKWYIGFASDELVIGLSRFHSWVNITYVLLCMTYLPP